MTASTRISALPSVTATTSKTGNRISGDLRQTVLGLVGIRAEQQVQHGSQNENRNARRSTERDLSAQDAADLIDHQGHSVSQNVLEQKREPEILLVAHLLGHGGDRSQAGRVKQVEAQEGDRRDGGREEGRELIVHGDGIFFDLAKTGQNAHRGQDAFLCHEAGQGRRDSLPGAEAERLGDPGNRITDDGIIISCIILKKTKMFSGDPAPFVMELPAYHLPTVGNVLRSMWERGWSFIKKAGTIILLSTIVVWFTTYFGFTEDGFRMLVEDEIDMSILGKIGQCLAWIFIPQGFGNWQATVAAVTGLVAKENIVATMGILYGGDNGVYANLAAAFTGVAGMSFLIFNLLCAPCFAAMGAIKREMNNAKWFWFAIGYECGFAYAVSLVVYQLGELFSGNANILGTIVAFALVAFMIYMLVRPYKESNTLRTKVRV